MKNKANYHYKLHYKKSWITLGLLVVAAVFYLCLEEMPPPVPFISIIPFQDKYIHFFVYMFLTWWFSRIYTRDKQLLIIFFTFCFMGLMIEILQTLTEHRTCELGDAIANTLGCAFGTWNLAGIFPRGLISADHTLKNLLNFSSHKNIL